MAVTRQISESYFRSAESELGAGGGGGGGVGGVGGRAGSLDVSQPLLPQLCHVAGSGVFEGEGQAGRSVNKA